MFHDVPLVLLTWKGKILIFTYLYQENNLRAAVLNINL